MQYDINKFNEWLEDDRVKISLAALTLLPVFIYFARIPFKVLGRWWKRRKDQPKPVRCPKCKKKIKDLSRAICKNCGTTLSHVPIELDKWVSAEFKLTDQEIMGAASKALAKSVDKKIFKKMQDRSNTLHFRHGDRVSFLNESRSAPLGVVESGRQGLARISENAKREEKRLQTLRDAKPYIDEGILPLGRNGKVAPDVQQAEKLLREKRKYLAADGSPTSYYQGGGELVNTIEVRLNNSDFAIINESDFNPKLHTRL